VLLKALTLKITGLVGLEVAEIQMHQDHWAVGI